MAMMGRQRGVVHWVPSSIAAGQPSLPRPFASRRGQEWCLPPQEMGAKSWRGSVFFCLHFDRSVASGSSHDDDSKRVCVTDL